MNSIWRFRECVLFGWHLLKVAAIASHPAYDYCDRAGGIYTVANRDRSVALQ